MEYSVKPILNVSLDDLSLSIRSRNCLKTIGINSVEDLVVLKEDDLLLVKNMGKKSLNEIKESIGKHGLALGMKRESLVNTYTSEMEKETNSRGAERPHFLG